jgi:hypothetical protein
MKLLYKGYELNIDHTRDIKYSQYFTGNCFDIELYSFIEYHFEDVKKLFIRLVDNYLQDYSLSDCKIIG